MENRNISNLIRDIVFYYIKFYYDKYLIDNKCILIEKEKITPFVEELYVDKTKELKDYIRNSLRKNLKEEYPKTIVENILLEMFADVNYCRTRIIDEIILYQDENLAVNN